MSLGTLPNSILHISRGSPSYNDDYRPDSRDSRLVWKAMYSGEFYVWVDNGSQGIQTGTYTLTVQHCRESYLACLP